MMQNAGSVEREGDVAHDARRKGRRDDTTGNVVEQFHRQRPHQRHHHQHRRQDSSSSSTVFDSVTSSTSTSAQSRSPLLAPNPRFSPSPALQESAMGQIAAGVAQGNTRSFPSSSPSFSPRPYNTAHRRPQASRTSAQSQRHHHQHGPDASVTTSARASTFTPTQHPVTRAISAATSLPASSRGHPSRGRGGFATDSSSATPSHRPSPREQAEEELAQLRQGRKQLANLSEAEQTLRNDLALWFTRTGEWNARRIRGVEVGRQAEEYPKLRRLMDLKATAVDASSHPPIHLSFNPVVTRPQRLTSYLSPHLFDVILIRPPPSYTWPEIVSIPVRLLSAEPSFVFLHVGPSSGDGLERGREALLKWGFRRCEELIWLKTKKPNSRRTADRDASTLPSSDEPNAGADVPENLFVTQKEHYLMGIRGTVRRKTDNHYVHCNVDTDVFVWDNPEIGTRRLELFGRPNNARRGWVTVGEESKSPQSTQDLPAPTVHDDHSDAVRQTHQSSKQETESWDSDRYREYIDSRRDRFGRAVVPQVEEIESLRPKSPNKGRPDLDPTLLSSGPARPAPSGQQRNFANTPPAGGRGSCATRPVAFQYRPPTSIPDFVPTTAPFVHGGPASFDHPTYHPAPHLSWQPGSQQYLIPIAAPAPYSSPYGYHVPAYIGPGGGRAGTNHSVQNSSGGSPYMTPPKFNDQPSISALGQAFDSLRTNNTNECQQKDGPAYIPHNTFGYVSHGGYHVNHGTYRHY